MSPLHDKLIHLSLKYSGSDTSMPGAQVLELVGDVHTELHALADRIATLELIKPLAYKGDPRG